jgi:hypothetical protein
MAAKKGQGLVRTALNQGYRTLLVLNVPKRLSPAAKREPRSRLQKKYAESGNKGVNPKELLPLAKVLWIS